MKIDEKQAVEIATKWLKKQQYEELPLLDVFYIDNIKSGEIADISSNLPARWIVVFKRNISEGFQDTKMYLDVNPDTGEVYVSPLM